MVVTAESESRQRADLMAGRRRTGAAIAIIGDVYQKSVDRRLGQEDERQKFNQRLQELGIKAGLESGAISPTFQGGQVGFQQSQLPPPMTMQDVVAQVGGAVTPQPAPPQPQGGMASRNEQGQFTTTITQDLDPYGRVKGVKVVRNEVKPKELSPRDRLFQDIQQAQGQLMSAQQQAPGMVSQLMSQPEPSFGVSEQVRSARPQNIRRVAMEPIRSAQRRLQGLQAQAGVLNQAGLLGTPGTVTQPDASLDPRTKKAVEELQSGRASIDEFLENESELQAAGVNTEAIRRLLGL